MHTIYHAIVAAGRGVIEFLTLKLRLVSDAEDQYQIQKTSIRYRRLVSDTED